MNVSWSVMSSESEYLKIFTINFHLSFNISPWTMAASETIDGRNVNVSGSVMSSESEFLKIFIINFHLSFNTSPWTMVRLHQRQVTGDMLMSD